VSKPNWQWPLAVGEALLWQGRPAPRCYTFRHWQLTLAGTALFFAGSCWLMLGWQLEEFAAYRSILLLLTVPLVVAAFLLGPWQLLLSRWRWENLYYALTDRQLLVRDGLLQVRFLSYSLDDISGWQQKRFGEQLASIRILRGHEAPLVFDCIEYPQNLTQYLPARVTSCSTGDSV
jgi:hypothetical protein